MITWAVAWASVKHKEPVIIVLVIFTMIVDAQVLIEIARALK